jgi:hypothetical protein
MLEQGAFHVVKLPMDEPICMSMRSICFELDLLNHYFYIMWSRIHTEGAKKTIE